MKAKPLVGAVLLSALLAGGCATSRTAIAPSPAPASLGQVDVVQMAQEHLSDQVIINQIRSTGSVFHLSASDITWLKQSGVSDPVVLEMQSTANRSPQPVYQARPVYAPPVYIEPYGYYGGGWGGYGRGWGGCGW